MKTRALFAPCSSVGRSPMARPLQSLSLLGVFASLLGCQEAPEQAPIRSLRASGETTFICVGPDGQGRPLIDCPQGPTLDDGGLTVAAPGNELVALVTQTVTAEVAVVRVTGQSGGSSTAAATVSRPPAQSSFDTGTPSTWMRSTKR